MAPNWLLDFGASYYVTSNISNLSLRQPYEGPDDIIISDGTGLNMTHVGKSTLSSPSHSFLLSNVLCVPSMKQNLISVSQFCKTNNASIEFYTSSFCAKDLTTGSLLAAGRSKNNVYEWSTGDISTTMMKQACVVVKASLNHWHDRLGHPLTKILHQVISQTISQAFLSHHFVIHVSVIKP